MRLSLFVIAFLSLATAAMGALASPPAAKKAADQASTWPSSNAIHRDIFCGTDGAEPSLQYAKTFNAEVNALTARGATVAAAVTTLRDRAKCPAGSQTPAPDVFTGGVK